ATISIATHAFNYGTGCFEGIRGYWNAEREEIYVVKLQEHFRRLLRSARLFRMDVGRTAEDLAGIALEIVRRGQFREDVYIRPIVYKASPVIRVGLLGLQDGFCCFTAAMGAYFDIEKGLSATVSGWRRNDDNSIPARAKATGGYINAALAIADAEDAGFDEAIMLTQAGNVSEGSAAN
ncbi:MAG TPA: branched chain amino acid aminotransferase, partial [Actinobacteria bacterium]|nr:branched chain amino acid aminotransferase [Actinomycetota bacterium]